MGKNRNRRRGRRSRRNVGGGSASDVAAQFTEVSIRRRIDENVQYDRMKKAQTDYLASVAEVEGELLSRTVLVSQVKNLKEESNLQLLKMFLEGTFGAVELCERTYGTGRRKLSYPNARVRFRSTQDAERLFGGKSLKQARSENPIDIQDCPVAHRGCIRVRPSDAYPGMTDSVISGSVIRFDATSVAIGHYFPAGKDCYSSMIQEQGANLDETDAPDEWLEEAVATNLGSAHSVEIDLKSRTVTISYRDSVTENLSYLLSFRFKDLLGQMELFRSQECLVFSLKYPPRLSKVQEGLDLFGEKREYVERQTDWNKLGTDVLGACLGYNISLDSVAVSRFVLNHEAVSKLHHFGILGQDLGYRRNLICNHSNIPQDCRSLATVVAGDEKGGLLLCSLVHNGKCCAEDAWTDQAAYVDDVSRPIAGLVGVASRRQAHRVLQRMLEMHGRTRFPAKLFLRLLQGEEDEGGEVDEHDGIPDHCVAIPRVMLSPTRTAVLGFEVQMSNRVLRKYVQDEGYPEYSFLQVTIGDENGDKLNADDLRNCSPADLLGPVLLALGGTEKEQGDSLEARLLTLLREGLHINGRHYRFLAYSSSQLKELSLWMVCPELCRSVHAIRGWMGDFSGCKTPPKYAARMGQCFSTTVQTLSTSADDSSSSLGAYNVTLRVDDDFPDKIAYDEKGKERCHSDGTGLISREHMLELVRRVPFAPSEPRDVSIIQIRFGGAKGTLTAWDLHTLPSSFGFGSYRCDVLLRPSMVKFKASYQRLEVCSLGVHIPYYLNRNVILLLGVHRVPDYVFREMQHTMLDNLDLMLKDECKAARMIPRLSGPDSRLSSSLVHMIAAGLSPKKEPFLFSCLHAIRSHHLMDLRKKSRIFVDRGAVLMGGLDETGRLPEGCIFLQVRVAGSPDRNLGMGTASTFEPILGPVLVTKHPVMHPGDVRMLLAVDVPELRHQKNVVLFSQRGVRPEADKMAGSDLDGDLFAVTWDSRLFLKEWNQCRHDEQGWSSLETNDRINLSHWENDVRVLGLANSAPMSYEAPPPPSPLSGIIEDKHIIQHFLNHAKSDNLGRIAMLWQDHAAKHGAACEQCQKLAELHSIAVDFPKSGVHATVPKDLMIHSSTPRPHWREKKGSPEYHCERVVGQLYDDVIHRSASNEVLKDSWVAVAHRKRNKQGQILCHLQDGQNRTDVLHAVFQPHIPACLGLDMTAHADDDILLEANRQRLDYEDRILSLMNKYSLHSEGELLTGCIRKYHKLHKRRRHDLSEEIRRQCREIRKAFRTEFWMQVWSESDQNAELLEEMEDEVLEERLTWAEKTVLGEPIHHEGDAPSNEMKTAARKRAAAYYVVAYSPSMRWRRPSEQGTLLFSFPWIVADVIAKGVNSDEALETDL